MPQVADGGSAEPWGLRKLAVLVEVEVVLVEVEVVLVEEMGLVLVVALRLALCLPLAFPAVDGLAQARPAVDVLCHSVAPPPVTYRTLTWTA